MQKYIYFLLITGLITINHAAYDHDRNDAVKALDVTCSTCNAYKQVIEFTKMEGNNILLIIGSKGSGKRALMKELKNTLNNKEKKEKALLFFDLYTIAQSSNIKDKDSLFQTIQKSIKEAEGPSEELPSKPFILFLENYEALLSSKYLNKSQSFYTEFDLQKTIKLDHYENMLVIATCQREALLNNTADVMFSLGRNKLNVLNLLPWKKVEIQKYIQKNYPRIQYTGPFDISIGAVQVAIATHQTLPGKNFKESFTWHSTFLKKWFSSEFSRRSRSLEQKKATETLIDKLAIRMFTHYTDFFLPQTGGYSSHPLWGTFFKQKNTTWDLLLNIPIVRKQGQKYTFLFPSLRDYYIAKAMLKSLDNINQGFLKKKHLNIIKMLAEEAQQNEKVKKYLFNIIQKSKKPIASANALSILAKANLLKGKNFSKIAFSAKQRNKDNSISQQGPYLAGADLRDVDLKNADLQGADLEGASLKKEYLQDSKLAGANMKNIRWSDSSDTTILPDAIKTEPTTITPAQVKQEIQEDKPDSTATSLNNKTRQTQETIIPLNSNTNQSVQSVIPLNSNTSQTQETIIPLNSNTNQPGQPANSINSNTNKLGQSTNNLNSNTNQSGQPANSLNSNTNEPEEAPTTLNNQSNTSQPIAAPLDQETTAPLQGDDAPKEIEDQKFPTALKATIIVTIIVAGIMGLLYLRSVRSKNKDLKNASESFVY